jgi:hypothetical protein
MLGRLLAVDVSLAISLATVDFAVAHNIDMELTAKSMKVSRGETAIVFSPQERLSFAGRSRKAGLVADSAQNVVTNFVAIVESLWLNHRDFQNQARSAELMDQFPAKCISFIPAESA